MALYWDWKEKVGEVTVIEPRTNEEHTVSLFTGNAFLIFINQYKEDGKDMYSLYSFFADEAHAKNCFGLTKGYDNIFLDRNGQPVIKKVRLNKKKYRYTNKLVSMLTKAFDTIGIEIYSEN